jgi:hypothetical protein
MTPLKVKSVVDAAVVGGVTYQGTFDASSPADLSNASKGDLYIISVAGSYQGQDWAVGDHLLINDDMGGTLDPNKIDKVDNTDAVTSVAGRTGAVVLSASDVSGLATVATSGAYSDLSGTPSLATVATTGAYSDLTGTPTLGTAAAEDVGTSAGNVVQLNGSAQLPAVDGSLLTNVSATVAALDDIGDVTITTPANTQVIKYNSTSGDWENGAVAYSELTDSVVVQSFSATATASAISSNALHVFSMGGSGGFTVTLPAATALNGFALFVNGTFSDVTVTGVNFRPHGAATSGGTSSITLKSGERRLYWVYLATIYLEVNSTLLGNNGDVTITSPSNGEALIYNSTSGDWENGTVSASVAALDDIGDVDTTGVSTNNVLKYDGANWVDGSVAYSEVTGTPSLATIATTGDYSDLNDSVVLQQFNATATASAISSNALHVFRFYGGGGFTLSLSTSTAFNGFALFNNMSSSDVTVNGGTFRANGEGVTGGSSSITVKAGERRLYYVEGASLYLESNSTLIGHNADVTINSPSNGEALIYNSTSGDWENGTVSATVAALNDVGDVTITTPANTQVIKYNSTSGDWENGSVAYSEVTGTPTLATVATTGAYSDLSGTPSLATVATTGAYSDLTGTPTLGTAAALDVGTSANNVVQLNGSAQLPAVDGSQLTGISATVAALNDIGDVSAAAPNNGDVIAYNSTTGDWEAAAQGVSVPSVTVSSPSADQTLSAPSGIEEAYIYTPSTDITVNLVAAATCGSGFKYQIKNRSTNTITIDPNGSETIDGSSTFDISAQEASVTLITDGSNWFII